MVKKSKRGRPSAISKEIADNLFQELSRGVPIEHACTIVGLKRNTYYYWRKKGMEEDEDSDSLYRYFYDRTEEGVAMAVATRVENIRIAGKQNWQADAWWLERMAHEYFGRKQTIDAKVDANVKQADISKLFDNEIVDKILREEEKEE